MNGSIYLSYINKHLPGWYHEVLPRLSLCLPVPIIPLECDIDLELFYTRERNQYHSTLILAQLLKSLPGENSKILGITGVDLFLPVLTFVFGEAQFNGKGALVSTYRLRNEFYGLPASEELFVERVVKEALHELGHTFGLTHCADYRCVMNSSTYVEDIDLKESRYCPVCRDSIGATCTRIE